MAPIRLQRFEISGLIDRLNARGTSRMLRDQPELTSDMRVAAAVLRAYLDLAPDVQSITVSPTDTPWSPSPPAGEAK
jgi:hypothetical protein